MLNSICQWCKARHCKKLGDELGKLKQFQLDAQTADAAYGFDPARHNLIRPATDEELANFGLTKDFMEVLNDKDGNRSGFRSAMFIDKVTGKPLVAFRGTTSDSGDIAADLIQGAGLKSAYYTRAQRIAERIAASPGGDQVRMVGHSLGGGLASAASRATGASATTFNAAGLNPMTQVWNMAYNGNGHIDSVYVKGEILTAIQKNSPLPEAASDAEWPLDPPSGFGASLLKKLGNLEVGDAAKAIALRKAELHRMINVTTALNQRVRKVEDRISKDCK